MSGLRSMRQGQDSLWSWAVSAALHTLAIGTAAPLLLEFTILPNQDTFRWDVTIRDAPPPEALAAEVPTALPSGDSQAPPLEDLSTAELEALRPHPTFEAIDAGTPSVPASLQEADRATPSFPAPVTGAGERAAPLPEPSSPSTTVSRPSIAPAAQSHEATPLGASGSAALPPPELDPAEPSLIAQDLVEEELRRIVHRPQAIEHAVHHRPIQAGYGWLAQSIWDKVERFKRYPQLARMNRWEGKVVLEAVIRETGRLSRIAVVESSGYAILDQDAVDTLRRCAPIKLPHALDRQEVTLHIPIMYRLN